MMSANDGRSLRPGRVAGSALFVLCLLWMLPLSGRAGETEPADMKAQFSPCSGCGGCTTCGKDVLTFGGSFRTRGEIREAYGFNDDAAVGDEDFLLTRLRLNATWTPNENVTGFVDLHDARMLFEDVIDDNDDTPNIFADNADLHQLWMQFKTGDVAIKVGRQKLNFGTQRLVGALEWVNTARSFDAVRVTLGDPKSRTLDLVSSRVVAVNPDSFNTWERTGNRYWNSDFHTIYFTDKEWFCNTTLDVYWMFRHEDDVNDAVHTLGTRFARKSGPWDYDGEFAVQWGDFGGLDQEAWAAHFGGGYTFECLNNLRLGAAYNFATGDGNPNDGDAETFDNLFPTNHKFYGYADRQAWKNTHNIELSAKMKVCKWTLRTAYHAFWLDEEDTDHLYGAAGGAIRNTVAANNPGAYVGSEIDITANYPISKKVSLAAGYSHYFTGDFLDDTGTDDDVDFAFLQVLCKF